MKCANCGTERSIGKFCPECGSQEIVTEKKLEAAKEIKCGNCGRIRARGNFCPDCGSQEIYKEPQVMVCSDCGTVRKTGRFCSECGSTNITYKPASLYENADIQTPVFIPDNKVENPPAPEITSAEAASGAEVVNNIEDIKSADVVKNSKNVKTSEEIYWELIDKKAGIDPNNTYVINDIPDVPLEEAQKNISIKDDLSDNPFIPMDVPDLNEETTEILKDDSDFDIFFSPDPKPKKAEKTPIAPLHSDFIPQELPVQNKAAEVKKPDKTQIDHSAEEAKSDNSGQPQSKTSQIYQQTPSNQQAQIYQQNQTYQQNQIYQQNQAFQQNQAYQWQQPYPMQPQNIQPDNTYYNYSGYGTDGGYIVRQPRPRNTAPLTSTGETLKKLRITIFILGILEFLAMFLPAVTYSAGRYSESVSVSDGHSFFIFLGLVIIMILMILAGFNNYFGVALAQLIQSLILSIASFFVVALINEERIGSKGIAYYLFLIVPIIMIIVSIATLKFSIQLKHEKADKQQ